MPISLKEAVRHVRRIHAGNPLTAKYNNVMNDYFSGMPTPKSESTSSFSLNEDRVGNWKDFGKQREEIAKNMDQHSFDIFFEILKINSLLYL